ncbi:MAG: O-antigen ligase family protein [Acidobacteria bacterium]|nr:O-antigen ligase family protein [Acidobacteriota bacterium]
MWPDRLDAARRAAALALQVLAIAAAVACLVLLRDTPLVLRCLWTAGLAAGAAAARRPELAIAAYAASLYGTPRYSPDSNVLVRSGVLDGIALFAVAGTALWRASHPQPRPSRLTWVAAALFVWIAVASVANWTVVDASRRSSGHAPILLVHAAAMCWVASAAMPGRAAARQWASWLGVGLGLRTFLQGREGIVLENDLGPVVLMVVPFAILLARCEPRRVARLAFGLAAILALGIVALTYNRASAVAFAAATFVFLWQQRHRGRWIAIGLTIAVLATGWFASGAYRERFLQAWQELQGTSSGSVTERFALWRASARLVADHPVVGVGPGRFATEVADYSPSLRGMVVHNSIIHAAAETGVPGAALYLALFLGVLALTASIRRHTSDPWQRELAGALQLSLIVYLIAGLFLSRHDMVMAYILAGWTIGLRREPIDGPPTGAAAAP